MPDTIQALAKKIKTAHPAYASLDDKELVSKVITKYPQYAEGLNPSDVIQLSPQAYSIQSARAAGRKPMEQAFEQQTAEMAPQERYLARLPEDQRKAATERMAEGTSMAIPEALLTAGPMGSALVRAPMATLGKLATSTASGLAAGGTSRYVAGKLTEDKDIQKAAGVLGGLVGGMAGWREPPTRLGWKGMSVEVPASMRPVAAAEEAQAAINAAREPYGGGSAKRPGYTAGGAEPTYGPGGRTIKPGELARNEPAPAPEPSKYEPYGGGSKKRPGFTQGGGGVPEYGRAKGAASARGGGGAAPARGTAPVAESVPSVSEGRPATWTNERVAELAQKSGPNQQAAIEQARLRKLTFPNMRYVTGEGSPFERGINAAHERIMRPLVKGTGEEGVLRVGSGNAAAARTQPSVVNRMVERTKDIAYGLTNPNPEYTHGFKEAASKMSGSPLGEMVGTLRGKGLDIPAGAQLHQGMAAELKMIADELPGKFTSGQRRLLEPLLNKQFESPEQMYDAVSAVRQKLGLSVGGK